MERVDQPGRVILLNGVPNAGKTTVAQLAQEQLEEAYWHLSLDDFLHGFSPRHRTGPNLPSFVQVMHGYMRSLQQLALCGINIVSEAVITPARLDTYLDLFGDLPVLLVGLHVPLEVARQREASRTDRSHYEVTDRDIEWVHAHKLYDLELDMARLTLEEAAYRVLQLVASPPSVTAFERLRDSRQSPDGRSS